MYWISIHLMLLLYTISHYLFGMIDLHTANTHLYEPEIVESQTRKALLSCKLLISNKSRNINRLWIWFEIQVIDERAVEFGILQNKHWNKLGTDVEIITPKMLYLFWILFTRVSMFQYNKFYPNWNATLYMWAAAVSIVLIFLRILMELNRHILHHKSGYFTRTIIWKLVYEVNSAIKCHLNSKSL